MSAGKRGGRRTARGTEGSSRAAIMRRRTVDASRGSQYEATSRRTDILVGGRRLGKSAWHSDKLQNRGQRRALARRAVTHVPINLPVTSDELEAIERLLGRELRLLFTRT